MPRIYRFTAGRKSKWRDVSEDFREDERYKELKQVSSDAPASMFDKFIEEVQRKFAVHARRAKELAASCPKLASSDSLKDFVQALAKQVPTPSALPTPSQPIADPQSLSLCQTRPLAYARPLSLRKTMPGFRA